MHLAKTFGRPYYSPRGSSASRPVGVVEYSTANSGYSVDYHLTPHGWIEGSSTFGIVNHESPPPSDRIETWSRTAEQSSGWSSEVVSWSRIWRDPATTDEEIR